MCKGKGISLEVWTGHKGSRSLRLPVFKTEYEGGKVGGPIHRPPLPPRKYSWYSLLLRGGVNPRATLRPEGCQWKIPMTKSGIEPAAFPSFSAVPQRTAPRRTPYIMCKGKVVLLQVWIDPEGSRKLRFPDFVTTAQDGGRLPALRTDRLYPQDGTHFC